MPSSSTTMTTAAGKRGSPARRPPQAGSTKKQAKAAKATRSAVINEKLADDGFDNQFGFNHFKTDWKKKVDEKYIKEGAWIPKQVGNELHYVFSDDDEDPAIVTKEKAKNWKEHVKVIAKKLNYEYTNGEDLYAQGKLTIWEFSALPKSNQKTKQFWQMCDGHMKAKSKWTSNMVKILSQELKDEVAKKAPSEKRGAQPHRTMVIGEQNIALVPVDDEGNLMDLTNGDEEEEDEEMEGSTGAEDEGAEEDEDSDDEKDSDEDGLTLAQLQAAAEIAAMSDEEATAADAVAAPAPQPQTDEKEENVLFNQFNGNKAAVVALYVKITGQPEPKAKGTAKSLRQELLDTHFTPEHLKEIAIGAEVPGVKRVKKPETLRAKIIEKLADGKFLPLPPASPAPSPKKRKATDQAGPSGQKSARSTRK